MSYRLVYTILLALFFPLALAFCGGGGSSTDTGGDGAAVSNAPVTGAISTEPWNGTWIAQTAGGVDVSSNNMSITFSQSALTRETAYVGLNYVRMMLGSCQLYYPNVNVWSDQAPSTDAQQATVWFSYSGMPAATGCNCGRADLLWGMTFPSTGGINLNTSSGLSLADCEAAGIFADGFESGDTSAWSAAVP